MPTDPTLIRIRERTPLYARVAVSKLFDLAEEVDAVLLRLGRTPEWLAEQIGISLEELTSWLGGMHTMYDPIAKIEAALQTDLMVGVTHTEGFFKENQLKRVEPVVDHIEEIRGYVAMIVNPSNGKSFFSSAKQKEDALNVAAMAVVNDNDSAFDKMYLVDAWSNLYTRSESCSND